MVLLRLHGCSRRGTLRLARASIAIGAMLQPIYPAMACFQGKKAQSEDAFNVTWHP
jgi:hypothetical protein